MTASPIQCSCDEGWRCEDHPDRAWGHDGCTGAGMHCLEPTCPFGRENLKRREIDEAINRQWYPEMFALEGDVLHLDRLPTPPTRGRGRRRSGNYAVGDVLALGPAVGNLRVLEVIDPQTLRVEQAPES